MEVQSGSSSAFITQVLEVDVDRGRFLLSLRPSDLRLCHRHGEEEVAALLREKMADYLAARDAILEGMVETETSMCSRLRRVYLVECCIAGG